MAAKREKLVNISFSIPFLVSYGNQFNSFLFLNNRQTELCLYDRVLISKSKNFFSENFLSSIVHSMFSQCFDNCLCNQSYSSFDPISFYLLPNHILLCYPITFFSANQSHTFSANQSHTFSGPKNKLFRLSLQSLITRKFENSSDKIESNITRNLYHKFRSLCAHVNLIFF